MNNRLQELYEGLSDEQRLIQFGRVTDQPLKEAFDGKRITHAGLTAGPVSEQEKPSVWHNLMQSTVNPANKRTAYIHIPFCQTKCLYCMFYQNPCQQAAMDEYVDILIKELQSSADTAYMQSGLVHSVFFGGGTPSSLSAANAARLFKAVREYLPLANDYEMTMEGRVSDLVPEKLESWFAGGVNRISIGVQSFDSKVRQQIGRIDPQETVISNLTRAAAYNQCSLIVDLMFGLPDQTMAVWQRDLEILDALPVDGADLYQLNLYENSGLKKAIEVGTLSPAATTAMQAEMFGFAHDWLNKRVYKRLSHCHWAKDNRERSLYNTLSKRGVDTIPFGCGAGGNMGAYTMMLHRNLAAYKQISAMGVKPVMALLHKSPNAAINSYITAQLEQGYLDFAKLLTIYGQDKQELAWVLDLFVQRGLMQYNGVLYTLTLAGQFWVVNITQTLLESLQYITEGEHSLAHHPVARQG